MYIGVFFSFPPPSLKKKICVYIKVNNFYIFDYLAKSHDGIIN